MNLFGLFGNKSSVHVQEQYSLLCFYYVFSVLRVPTEWHRGREEWIAMFGNEQWCNPGHIGVKEYSHSRSAGCDSLNDVVSQPQTQHSQSVILISGSFNHASLSSSLPTFTQYVKYHTRVNKTLD